MIRNLKLKSLDGTVIHDDQANPQDIRTASPLFFKKNLLMDGERFHFHRGTVTVTGISDHTTKAVAYLSVNIDGQHTMWHVGMFGTKQQAQDHIDKILDTGTDIT